MFQSCTIRIDVKQGICGKRGFHTLADSCRSVRCFGDWQRSTKPILHPLPLSRCGIADQYTCPRTIIWQVMKRFVNSSSGGKKRSGLWQLLKTEEFQKRIRLIPFQSQNSWSSGDVSISCRIIQSHDTADPSPAKRCSPVHQES